SSQKQSCLLPTDACLQLCLLWCSKRNSDVAGSADKLSIDRHSFNVCTCLRDRNGNDLAGLERDHLTGLAVGQGAHGASAKIRSEHSIESVRAAASLQMTEHHTPRFLTGQLFRPATNVIARPTEPKPFRVEINFSFSNLHRAFGNDYICKFGTALFTL